MLIGSGLFGVALLFAAAIVFLQTPLGVLRVEIHDPDIEVRVRGTEFVLKGADKEDVSLQPGKHVLHVKRGDFEFDTTALTLKKNDTVVVKVDWFNGAVVANVDYSWGLS